MKIMIATDTKIYIDGPKIYVTEKLKDIIFRYYNSFGKLNLLVRVFKEKPNAILTDITEYIDDIVCFNSFTQLFFNRTIFKRLAIITKKCDLTVGRFESFAAIKMYKLSRKFRIPFFGEVMSDPWDGLWNHSFIGKCIAPYSFLMTKKAMKNANFGLYVTKEYLQRRYPCKNKTIGVSNVCIKELDKKTLTKRFQHIEGADLKSITLTTVGAVYVKYKGQKYVIDAIPKLNSLGIHVRYFIIGEGDKTALLKRAIKNRVENQVVFTGRLSAQEVISYLDSTDVYVHPSLQEGLPRAVVEAMSRGCPCIGTPTGGIPELLSADYIFKKKSSKAITKSVLKVLDFDLMKVAARTNFNKAKEFEDSILTKKRDEYYSYVKESLRTK